MAGTGRGLRLLQQLVDHRGTLAQPDGKTVWFELDSGDRLGEIASSPAPDAVDAGFTPAASGDEVVDVVLLDETDRHGARVVLRQRPSTLR